MRESVRRIRPAVLVFAAALAPRLLHLDKAFSNDEMATATWAIARSFGELSSLLYAPFEGNAAGYPFFIHAWALLGHGEAWLRIPSVLAGAGTACLLYLRAARRFRGEAAIWGALMFAYASLPMAQSQNARVYSLFAFVCLLALEALERSLAGCRKAPVAFGVLSLLALSLHRFAILYLAPLYALLLWRGVRERRFVGSLVAPGLALLLFAPELPLFWYQIRNGPTWIPPATLGSLAELVPRLIWIHGAAATNIALAFLLLGAAARFRLVAFDLAYAVIPIVECGILSELWRPLERDYYLFPSVPCLFLLLSAGADVLLRAGLAWRTLCRFAIAGLLGAAILGLPAYYARRNAVEWRDMAEFIGANRGKCGNVMLTHPDAVDRWRYFFGDSLDIRPWRLPYPSRPFWLTGTEWFPPVLWETARRSSDPKWDAPGVKIYCVHPE